jgi:hypothetical protein
MIPEEVGNWILLWQPEQDLTELFRFSWSDAGHLRDAVTLLLTTHMDAIRPGGLDILADRRFSEVKMLIASNPDTPHMVLEYLAEHSCSSVLERIAENPNTPNWILERLADSDCTEVRAAVAENSHTPAELVKGLSHDDNPDIRFTVAENAGTPIEVLQLLEMDDNPYVSHRAHQTLSRLQGGCIQQGDFRRSQASATKGLNARPAH